MKSDYELWRGAVSYADAYWESARKMPVDTEPERLSRREAFHTAGALIMQLEFLARLSIIGPDGKSIGMRARLDNLMKHAESLNGMPVDVAPPDAVRFIDMDGMSPLCGDTAAGDEHVNASVGTDDGRSCR